MAPHESVALDVNIERFRNLVIGCGEAGKYLACNLAQLGEATVLVDRAWLADRVHISCLPSMNVFLQREACFAHP